jgi:hypothetical protein
MVLGRLLRVDSEHGKLEWMAEAAANSQDGGLDLGQDSVSIASDISFPIMPAVAESVRQRRYALRGRQNMNDCAKSANAANVATGVKRICIAAKNPSANTKGHPILRRCHGMKKGSCLKL